MKTLLLKNADVIVPGGKLKKTSVLIADGRIAEIGAKNVSGAVKLDYTGQTLYPGFIDLHIHGAAGIDLMNCDDFGLYKLASFLYRNGTTRWMPTLVPDSEENYQRAIRAITGLCYNKGGGFYAKIAGVHYEGPFVNEKQCGALHEQYFRNFDKASDLSSLPKLPIDNVRHMMTLAPEVSGGIKLIKALCKKGWIVSLGHTRADIKTLEAAFAAGARHITHFFNAMSGIHHRDLGVAGWGLSKNEMTCDVIADGVHVHPEILKLLYKVKTANGLSLISDAILPTGRPDGKYTVWGEKISVKKGRTSNERGNIAGSVITMADAVRMMLSLGVPEWDAAQMASTNPARILGIDAEYGSIEVGKYAEMVALDQRGNVKPVSYYGLIY